MLGIQQKLNAVAGRKEHQLIDPVRLFQCGKTVAPLLFIDVKFSDIRNIELLMRNRYALEIVHFLQISKLRQGKVSWNCQTIPKNEY